MTCSHCDRLYLEISATVADTAVGQVLFQVCCWRLSPLAGVDIQDCAAGLQVGQRKHEVPVESGSQPITVVTLVLVQVSWAMGTPTPCQTCAHRLVAKKQRKKGESCQAS